MSVSQPLAGSDQSGSIPTLPTQDSFNRLNGFRSSGRKASKPSKSSGDWMTRVDCRRKTRTRVNRHVEMGNGWRVLQDPLPSSQHSPSKASVSEACFGLQIPRVGLDS